MDVVILAGGETPTALTEALGAHAPAERALLPIAGRSCLEHLLDSLRGVDGLGTIACVGKQRTLELVQVHMPEVVGVNARNSLVENVLAGAENVSSAQLLLCTVDIPLVTAHTWSEFLRRVRENDLEAAYPIVRREAIENAFPEGKRTYASLLEGTFTGGNAFILPRAHLADLRVVIDAAYNARKNPLSLARLLGVGFVLKAIAKRLSILDLERKMSQVLKCRAGAVEMNDATIAFDVDKPDDFELAQKILAARPS